MIIKKLLIPSLVLTLIVITSFIGQQHASALFSGATNQACSGAQLSSTVKACTSSSKSVLSVADDIILILSWIVGIASVIMVIIGGFRFVISSGDSNATSSARSTVLYALIGLAVAAIAQVLVYFVLNKVS